jgi:hypothetical protein
MGEVSSVTDPPRPAGTPPRRRLFLIVYFERFDIAQLEANPRLGGVARRDGVGLLAGFSLSHFCVHSS